RRGSAADQQGSLGRRLLVCLSGHPWQGVRSLHARRGWTAGRRWGQRRHRQLEHRGLVTAVRTVCARSRSHGFTLIEILIVVVIIGVISAAVLLSVNLTGRDRDLEKESERLLALVNYAREQAELQTREYGVIFHDDAYQFVAYDLRRGVWREVYEDDALRLRRLPDGLDVKLVVDARPVILVSMNASPLPGTQKKPQSKSLKDINSLKDVASLVRKLGDDDKSSLEEAKKIAPQVTIYSNG